MWVSGLSPELPKLQDWPALPCRVQLFGLKGPLVKRCGSHRDRTLLPTPSPRGTSQISNPERARAPGPLHHRLLGSTLCRLCKLIAIRARHLPLYLGLEV